MDEQRTEQSEKKQSEKKRTTKEEIAAAAEMEHKNHLAEEAALIAKAEKAMREWEAGARESAVAIWDGIPPQYAHWVFYRCGLKSSNVAQGRASRYCGIGYKLAPASVRIVGGAFLEDGESNGLYIMAPPQVYEKIEAMRVKLRLAKRANRRAILGNGLEEINRLARSVRASVIDRTTGKEVDPGEVFDAMARG